MGKSYCPSNKNEELGCQFLETFGFGIAKTVQCFLQNEALRSSVRMAVIRNCYKIKIKIKIKIKVNVSIVSTVSAYGRFQ